MKNGTKIVTALYELKHEDSKGGMIYKSFPLTSLTIREIIFDDFEYVIYTDKHTYETGIKHHMPEKPNVKIKFQELNGDLYKNVLNPIREKRYQDGDIWERYYAVKNYEEVIINKFKFLLNESEEGKNTFWIDAGLFGTSCNDGWRDYMVEIAHTENFINKVSEKIDKHGFICLRGLDIQINIDLKHRLLEHFGIDFKLVPGALFGGKHQNIIDVLSDYKKNLVEYVTKYQELISEQEILSILTHKNQNVKFYDFGDWLDLQKGLLNIMDVFDESKYLMDSCELYSTKYLDRYKPYR
jgi:hypothetical protein